jgi:hypothetical protein
MASVTQKKVTVEIHRSGATTKGSTNTYVPIYPTSLVSNGGAYLTYVNDPALGDSILVNKSGIYAVMFMIPINTTNPTIEIRKGSIVDNSYWATNPTFPSTLISKRSWVAGGQDADDLMWVGYVEEGMKIWTVCTGSLGSTYPAMTQFRVTKVS